MILADKIINERKKLGWSQEELAEKLSVSRQSVSKWEGAQAIPDIQKIITMAEIFGVTTDYLLKDEIEPAAYSETVRDIKEESIPEPPVRKVSMAEASEYIEQTKSIKSRIANGVSLCICSPVILILLAGLSDELHIMSENVAAAIGIVFLLGSIAFAVFNFISIGNKTKKFEYLEYEAIETEYGVSGMVKAKKEAFQDKFTRTIGLGVALCILAVLPLVLSACLGASDVVLICMTDVLLLIIACAVGMFIRAGMEMDCYNKLLQEEEFSKAQKIGNKKTEKFFSLYWLLVTAGYLAWSFITFKWGITWIVWPIAGVLFAVYAKIVKIALKVE